MLIHKMRKISFSPAKERDVTLQVLTLSLLVLAVFWPEMVVAAEVAGTLGAIMCNARENAAGMPPLMNAVAFVSGAVLLLRGALLLKKHADNPNDSQIAKALWHFVGGAGLMSLPLVAGLFQRTVLGEIGGGSAWSCKPGEIPSDGTKGLDTMMQNFIGNIHAPILMLISFISILVGLVYIMRSLFKAAKSGTGAQGSDPKSIIVHMVVGAILISTGTSFFDVHQSLFGDRVVTDVFTYSGIAWSKLTGSEDSAANAKKTVNSVFAFVQIIGVIAFTRGWLVLKAALDGGQATVPQGIVFVVAGVMAVNITKMVEIFDKTFGTQITSLT